MGTATSSLLNFSGSLKQLLIFLRLPWRRLAVLLRRGAAELRPLQGDGLGQPPLLAQLQLQLLQDKLRVSHSSAEHRRENSSPWWTRATTTPINDFFFEITLSTVCCSFILYFVYLLL